MVVVVQRVPPVWDVAVEYQASSGGDPESGCTCSAGSPTDPPTGRQGDLHDRSAARDRRGADHTRLSAVGVARVKAGERQRNALGVIEFTSVATVDAISDDDAVAAGFADASDALPRSIGSRGRLALPDRRDVRRCRSPPHASRARRPRTGRACSSLRQRLRRMDRGDAWTESYLRLIAANPGVVAANWPPRWGWNGTPSSSGSADSRTWD